MEITGTAYRLRELWRFMATRAFVASRAELIASGFGADQIQSWIRSGRIIPVMRGVYSYGRDIESSEAAWTASLAAAGPGSALTGISACEKWGMVRLQPDVPRRIDVAVGKGQARTLKGISPAMLGTDIRVARRSFGPGDIRKRDGIVLLRAALALLDFAERATEREVRFAFLEACRLNLFDEQDVAYCFRKIVGRRGARKLRPLASMWMPELKRIRSVFEGLFLLLWIERRLPMPLVNERVFGKEVDLFWPNQKLALELDGGAFHHDPIQRSIDREKQVFLEANGLEVLRLTYGQFDANPNLEVDRVALKLGHEV